MPLFSWLWKSKNERNPPTQGNRKRRRRSRGNSELVYIVQEDNNISYFGTNNENEMASKACRRDNVSQNPQFKNLYLDASRQTRTYQESPERRNSKRVSLHEQSSLLLEKPVENRRFSTEPNNLMVFATTAVCLHTTSDDNLPYGVPIENGPRRSTLNQNNEIQLIAQDYTGPEDECHENSHTSPSGTDKNRNIREDERQNILKVFNANVENSSPKNSRTVKQNVLYLVSNSTTTEPKDEPVLKARSPRLDQSSKNFPLGISVNPTIYRAQERVQKMSIKAKRQPPTMTTADGKILKLLKSGKEKKLSVSSSRNSALKKPNVRSSANKHIFPLAQQEAIVAAPLIGAGRMMKQKGFGQHYGSPNPYYDNGYEYYDDDEEDHFHGVACRKCAKKNRSVHQIYVSQAPVFTLPKRLLGNTGGSPNTPDTHVDKRDYNVTKENPKNKVAKSFKEADVKSNFAAQQTENGKDSHITCLLPENIFTVADPDSKIKWRIIIKKNNEE